MRLSSIAVLDHCTAPPLQLVTITASFTYQVPSGPNAEARALALYMADCEPFAHLDISAEVDGAE